MNTMNFLRDKRNKNSEGLFTEIFFGVLIIIVVVICLPLLDKKIAQLDASVWNLSTPLQKSIASVSQSKKKLVQNIDILEERVNALEIERLQFETFASDTENINLKNSTTSSRVVAFITTRPAATPYDSFIIDRGSNDGIAVENLVYVYNTLLLGQVSDVQKTSATIRAYSSPQQQISAYHSASGSSFDIVGRGNGNFQVNIPQGVDIVEGDVLLSQKSARDVLGVVEYIVSDEREPFKEIYIRIPANINNIQYVQVQTESNE